MNIDHAQVLESASRDIAASVQALVSENVGLREDVGSLESMVAELRTQKGSLLIIVDVLLSQSTDPELVARARAALAEIDTQKP